MRHNKKFNHLELLKVTTDKEYRNKLLIEYGIA